MSRCRKATSSVTHQRAGSQNRALDRLTLSPLREPGAERSGVCELHAFVSLSCRCEFVAFELGQVDARESIQQPELLAHAVPIQVLHDRAAEETAVDPALDEIAGQAGRGGGRPEADVDTPAPAEVPRGLDSSPVGANGIGVSRKSRLWRETNPSSYGRPTARTT